jgi:hypothetical protein
MTAQGSPLLDAPNVQTARTADGGFPDHGHSRTATGHSVTPTVCAKTRDSLCRIPAVPDLSTKVLTNSRLRRLTTEAGTNGRSRGLGKVLNAGAARLARWCLPTRQDSAQATERAHNR